MSATPYFPDIYDAFNRGSADVDWYTANAIRVGGPVLELGCGTGRTLLPIARAGVDIDGIDLSAEMLAALRAKLIGETPAVQARVSVREGDMAAFSSERAYSVVQIPFRSFLHNTSRATQLSCLRCCHDVLLPGGTLALNVFFPSLEYMAQSVGAGEHLWRIEATSTSPNGDLTLFQEWSEYRTVAQTLRSIHRFETFDAKGVLQVTRIQLLDLAYLYPGDLRSLLAEAGFQDVRITSGFDEGPLTRDDEEMLVVAAKAG